MTLLTLPLCAWVALAADQVAPDAAVPHAQPAPVADRQASPASAPANQVPARPHLATVAFAVAHEPQARRTKKWTRPRAVAKSVRSRQAALPFSRFLDLTHPIPSHTEKRPGIDREWTRDLIRFTRDVIADLNAALGEACPPGRCARTLDQARRRLDAFGAASVAAIAYQDRTEQRSESEIWNGWHLAGGSAEIDVGCVERIGALEVECRLMLDLDRGMVLSYRPGAALVDPEPAIALTCQGDDTRNLLGEVRFGRTYSGTPVALLAGIALAEHADSSTPVVSSECASADR